MAIKIPTLSSHRVSYDKLATLGVQKYPDYWLDFGYQNSDGFWFRVELVRNIPLGTNVLTLYSLTLACKIDDDCVEYLVEKAGIDRLKIKVVKGQRAKIQPEGNLVVPFDFNYDSTV